MLHQTVLLKESIDALKIKENGIYLDCTLGSGGHTQAILKKLNKHGKIYAVDKDPKIIEIAKKKKDKRIQLIHENFSKIPQYIYKKKPSVKMDGIIIDLGISTDQLQDRKRGFSFLKNGPLDMRMNNEKGKTVLKWLKTTNIKKLTYVIKNFGEERYAKKIARSILYTIKKKDITTLELVNIIKSIIPKNKNFKHPATRTFQALRMYINKEIQELKKILNSIFSITKKGTRLSIISFHSLEEQIIKKFFKKNSQKHIPPIGLPITEKQIYKLTKNKIIMIKKIKPTIEEIYNNPSSRSATLRIGEFI